MEEIIIRLTKDEFETIRDALLDYSFLGGIYFLEDSSLEDRMENTLKNSVLEKFAIPPEWQDIDRTEDSSERYNKQRIDAPLLGVAHPVITRFSSF